MMRSEWASKVRWIQRAHLVCGFIRTASGWRLVAQIEHHPSYGFHVLGDHRGAQNTLGDAKSRARAVFLGSMGKQQAQG